MIVRHANILLMNLSRIEESSSPSENHNSGCRRGGQFRIMDETNIVKESRGVKKDDSI